MQGHVGVAAVVAFVSWKIKMSYFTLFDFYVKSVNIETVLVRGVLLPVDVHPSKSFNICGWTYNVACRDCLDGASCCIDNSGNPPQVDGAWRGVGRRKFALGTRHLPLLCLNEIGKTFPLSSHFNGRAKIAHRSRTHQLGKVCGNFVLSTFFLYSPIRWYFGSKLFPCWTLTLKGIKL